MGAAPSFSNLRPGYPICPPAVARHVVYRLRLDDNPHWPSDHQSPRDKWATLCRHFAEHVAELRRDYGNRDEKVEFREPAEPADAAAGCFSLGASCLIPITRADEPEGYRLRVRIDVHTELVSLTYIFDQIREGRLADCIAGLERDSPKARPASDWLFDGMWNVGAEPAEQVTAARAVAQWGERPIPHQTSDGIPAERVDRWNDVHITDFKGIIICPRPDWPMGETQIGDGVGKPAADGRPDHRRALAPALAEFAGRNDRLIRAIADPQSLDFEAGRPGDSVSRACVKGGEPVVCGMLDGAALYAAALGEWGGDEKPHPVRHLLVYAGHSYSQVGRLVRRMHVLGELRHAALIDFDADDVANPAPGRRGLRETSRKLRSLGRCLTADTPRITAARDDENGVGESGDEEGVRPFTAKEAMQRLTEFVNELADVSAMVDGGLTHRVEQSRYYAGEFKATVEQLRIIRLGAWQPYDDFVQRYILHLFARVDRIGNRFEAFGRRLDRLLFVQQAKLLDRYTSGMSDMLGQIRAATNSLHKSANDQLGVLNTLRRAGLEQLDALRDVRETTALVNDSSERQIATSKQQTELLETAERFAIVFLIYYVGTVLYKPFEEYFKITLGNFEFGKTQFRLTWIVLILLAAVWLLVHLVPAIIRKLSNRNPIKKLACLVRRLAGRVAGLLQGHRSSDKGSPP